MYIGAPKEERVYIGYTGHSWTYKRFLEEKVIIDLTLVPLIKEKLPALPEYTYAVDNFGVVYRWSKKEQKWVPLAQVHNNRYYHVNLVCKGKKKVVYVHDIVFSAFGECDIEYSVVDHLDRGRGNNFIGNLEGGTRRTNANSPETMKARKRVVCYLYTADTYEFVCKFDSVTEASIFVGKDITNTARVLCGCFIIIREGESIDDYKGKVKHLAAYYEINNKNIFSLQELEGKVHRSILTSLKMLPTGEEINAFVDGEWVSIRRLTCMEVWDAIEQAAAKVRREERAKEKAVELEYREVIMTRRNKIKKFIYNTVVIDFFMCNDEEYERLQCSFNAWSEYKQLETQKGGYPCPQST